MKWSNKDCTTTHGFGPWRGSNLESSSYPMMNQRRMIWEAQPSGVWGPSGRDQGIYRWYRTVRLSLHLSQITYRRRWGIVTSRLNYHGFLSLFTSTIESYPFIARYNKLFRTTVPFFIINQTSTFRSHLFIARYNRLFRTVISFFIDQTSKRFSFGTNSQSQHLYRK